MIWAAKLPTVLAQVVFKLSFSLCPSCLRDLPISVRWSHRCSLINILHTKLLPKNLAQARPEPMVLRSSHIQWNTLHPNTDGSYTGRETVARFWQGSLLLLVLLLFPQIYSNQTIAITLSGNSPQNTLTALNSNNATNMATGRVPQSKATLRDLILPPLLLLLRDSGQETSKLLDLLDPIQTASRHPSVTRKKQVFSEAANSTLYFTDS